MTPAARGGLISALSDSTAESTAPRAWSAGPVQLALWFGLAGGIGESLLFALRRFALHYFTRMSYQNLWAAPIAVAALFAVPGGIVWLAARVRPALRWWQPTITVFASVATFGFLLHSYALYPIARLILAAGIGVSVGRWAAGHQAAASALVRRTLPALAALVALTALGVNATVWLRERRAVGALPAPPEGAPNVLLLILDTVRALDLSVYGYDRPTTPSLEHLAARGVTFDHAISPAPWTLASHAAIFTGRHPSELSASWEAPLDRRFPTLAEAFRDRGYLTTGFAANIVYVSDESGLARGFAHYDAVRVTPWTIALSARILNYILETDLVRGLPGLRDLLWRRGAGELRVTIADWLASHPGRPWFAFANFYDAHNPYLPPAPWDTLFLGRVPWRERNPWVRQTEPLSVAQAKIERDAYDGTLAYLDHELGAMLDDMEARGLLRNTIVIVTADHGEEFGEHGLLGHGNSLYLQSVHVPLIVAWPGRIPAGRRIESTVSLSDLAATALDLAGLGAALPGRSMRGLWSGDSTTSARPVVAQVQYARGLPAWFPVSQGDLGSVVTDTRQYIRTGTRREELFDLQLDPTGGRPAGDDSEVRSRLRALLPVPPGAPLAGGPAAH